MAKKSPWHSVKQPVYHDDTNCNTGNNIERENLRRHNAEYPPYRNGSRDRSALFPSPRMEFIETGEAVFWDSKPDTHGKGAFVCLFGGR